MSDYSNFMRRYGGWMPGMDAAMDLYDSYVDRYENSHGKERYYLGNVPGFSWIKRLEDKAQKAQDQWDNSKTDPAYADRIDSSLSGAITGSVGALGKLPGMAFSLVSMYTPEVVENVGKTRRRR